MDSSSSDDRPIGFGLTQVQEYDEEGYIVGDDDDREQLMEMSQIKREQTLASRLESQRLQQDRAHAEQVLAERKRKEQESAQAMSEDEDSSDDQPIGSGLPSGEALNSLLPGHQDESDDSDDRPLGMSQDTSLSKQNEEVSSSESSVNQENDTRDSFQQSEPEDDKLNLKDLRKAQIKRSALEKIYREPYFASYVVGLYCRQYYSTVNKQAKYRICKIKGIVHSRKHYTFVESHPTTTMMLKLEHPRGYCNSQMKIISNSPFSQEEFSTWHGTVDYPPSPQDLDELRRHAEKLKQEFRYTVATLQKMQKEQENRVKDVSRIGNITQEKIKVNRQLEIALRAQDDGRCEELRMRLVELDEEQRRRYQKELKSSRVNINQINLALRKKNSRKDIWLNKITSTKMKTDRTNRHILNPSIEKFGKSMQEQIRKEKEREARTKERKKVTVKKKAVKKTHKLQICPKIKVNGPREDATGVPPKDELWKRVTGVCKSIPFPQNPEPKFKQPDTWLGTMNYYPTTFAKECLIRPNNVTIYSLESYLGTFKPQQ